jgi:FtsH-binding integral membrane protein
MNPNPVNVQAVEVGIQLRPLLRRVYLWMTAGVLVTAIFALLTATSPMLSGLLTNPFIVWGALIAELVLVIVLSAAIKRLPPLAAVLLFFVYAGLLGFSLSGIFLVYSLGSIAVAFFSAAALFGMMTLVGFVTNADLTRLGTYLVVGLFGLLVAMVLNLFFRSGALGLVLSLLGIVIFTGLTAYDTQKIAKMAADPKLQQESDAFARLSVLGALTLYLDFINLFLLILQLLGRRD